MVGVVRTAWCLLRKGGAQQLFNMLADPQETANLAGQPAYRRVEADLTAMLLDWYVRTTTRTGPEERSGWQRVAVGP